MRTKVLIPDNFEDLSVDATTSMASARVELSKDKGFPYRLIHGGIGAAGMDTNAAWQMASAVLPPGTVPPEKFFRVFPEHSLDILNYGARCTSKVRITRMVKDNIHPDGLLVRGFVSRRFMDITPPQMSNLIGRFNMAAVGHHDGHAFEDPDGIIPGFFPNMETNGPLVRRSFANLVGPKIQVPSGEVYRAMARMSTGHVGAESYRVSIGLWQEICTNGLVVPVLGGVFALRGKHIGAIGSKLANFMDVAAERTKDAPKWVAALETTRTVPVEDPREEDHVLSRWMRPASHLAFLTARHGKATRKQFTERSVVISRNVYGLYDAVTRWTQTQDYDMRQEIEAKVGGYILDRFMPN